MAKESYYAVRHGKKPGIYYNWPDCNSQVSGFKGAVFKKFSTRQEAAEFIQGGLKTQMVTTKQEKDTTTTTTPEAKTKPQKRKHSKKRIRADFKC